MYSTKNKFLAALETWTSLLLLLFEVRGSLRPVWMRQLVGAEPRGPISCHGNGSSP